MNIAPNAPAISPMRSSASGQNPWRYARLCINQGKPGRLVHLLGASSSLLRVLPGTFLGLYSLELDYQERFENFSDFGGTERPKFSVRWQPIDSALTIRATYSEAFHAPTLSDLFARGSDTSGADFVFDPRSPVTGSECRGEL